MKQITDEIEFENNEVRTLQFMIFEWHVFVITAGLG